MDRVWVYCSNTDLKLVQPLIDSIGLEQVLEKVFGFDKNQQLDNNKGDDLLGELSESGWYRIKHCDHVNRQGDVVSGIRYTGYERSDKSWLANNLASDEVKLFAKGDASLIDELVSLRNGR